MFPSWHRRCSFAQHWLWHFVLPLSPPPFPVGLSLSSSPLSSWECACVFGGLSAPGETGECGCNCLVHIVPRTSVCEGGGVDRHHPSPPPLRPISLEQLKAARHCLCKHIPFSLSHSHILSLSLYLTPSLESRCRSLSLISYLYLFFSLLSREKAILSLTPPRVYTILSLSYSIVIFLSLLSRRLLFCLSHSFALEYISFSLTHILSLSFSLSLSHTHCCSLSLTPL